MKAVIMAGGEGTRLRPLTSNQPKPMMTLANRPMMEHIVGLLREHGFEEIVVTVAFMANAIRTYFGDGSEFGVHMVYATEESPLGTAGSVRNAMEQLDERFLVISGDVLTDINLSEIVKFHEERGALATIGLKAMENPLEFGIVITNEDGTIERFLEKPGWGQVFSDTINTGIYVLEPEIFDYIPAARQVDFSEEVFPALLDANKPLYGYVAEGYWEDVGTLEAYNRAHQDVLDERVIVDVPGFRMGDGIWLGEGAEVHPQASIQGPVVIGAYSVVEAGAHLREYTVLGSNVWVGPDAYLERAVVHDNAYLGPAVRLRGCVVGRACDLRRGARCEEGVVLGDECFVGEHAVINPNVKVYPFKTVEQGAIINSSIVWESRGARHLFGRAGVSGLANVDITPELAVRVAMAYATTLKKGASVTTSRDSSRAARALKRAVMVGLNAAGVNVSDLEVATVPVTRFHVRATQGQGGITVRLSEGDPQSVTIRFFDAEGIDLDETAHRKIERLFYREDFRRARAGEMGDIGFPARALEFYTEALMATVDTALISHAAFKVVLDYGYGSASFVMPNVLAKLGADVLSVNPYAATAGAAAFDRASHAEKVSELVKASGAHLGAVLDPGGERITLIDDSGRVLSDDDSLYALLSLMTSTHGISRVALPVAISTRVEELCADAGCTISWTKLSSADLMDKASHEDVGFAASQEGGFIFPDFLPAYDATATLVHVLDLLARTGVRLSKVAGQIPEFHVAHETVVTPWEQKGMVMRTLIEELKDNEVVLVDGVKVHIGGGWVLVLPDPEDPVTHVWAEGADEREARTLAQDFSRRIRELLR
ncbi:MAG TPA: mannose-1-phosphate guanyltransferase [Acidimicrobiales bacterium]|nr:mannose-1-phosphate guanyltransferase [Acidimicrobiales bacterium]